MKIDIITTFPDYFYPLNISILGQAIKNNKIKITLHNLHDVTNNIDDKEYGSEYGMLIKAEPIWQLIKKINNKNANIIFPVANGYLFNQQYAKKLSLLKNLIIICGRYEGIDYRIIDILKNNYTIHEISIGDYILFGGESASIIIIESITRLLTDVIQNKQSINNDSFSNHYDNILEEEKYTKPQIWRGISVPKILLSGNTHNINSWRREQSLKRTFKYRNELLKTLPINKLSSKDIMLLEELKYFKKQ